MNAEPTIPSAAVRSVSPMAMTKSGLRLARRYGILVCFAILFITLSIASDSFLTWTNLENILSQQSPTLIVAAAGTLVIIAGGFDLSVAAIVALTGVIAAKLAGSIDPAVGIAAGILAGGVLGVGNGLVTTVGRVNALIGTLATSFIFRGIAVVITGGLLVTVSDSGFTKLGRGEIAGVPIAIVVMVVVVGALGFLLSSTAYGRRIFAVGGNPEAARLAGVRVDTVRCATFVMSGLAAGLAGVLLASRLGTGQADAATGFEFSVIAGIVVGGTSIQGGEGAVWRTVVGVLLIALIGNGFTLLGLDPTYQQMVQGAIILAAVGADSWHRVRRV